MLDLYLEFQGIVDLFSKHKIPYALCGGMAMAVYAEPRATIDIDLVVQAQDLESILEKLNSIEFSVRASEMKFSHGKIGIRRISKVDKNDGDLLCLDLLTLSEELQHLWLEERQELPWENSSIWVLSPQGIIALKKLRNSPQDQVDIRKLQEIDQDKV